MKRMAIVLGAVGVTAAIAPMLPSTAHGATSFFQFVVRGNGYEYNLVNPVAGQCYVYSGGKHGWNHTEFRAELFGFNKCQDPHGPTATLSPGYQGFIPMFDSVKFIPAAGTPPGH